MNRGPPTGPCGRAGAGGVVVDAAPDEQGSADGAVRTAGLGGELAHAGQAAAERTGTDHVGHPDVAEPARPALRGGLAAADPDRRGGAPRPRAGAAPRPAAGRPA